VGKVRRKVSRERKLRKRRKTREKPWWKKIEGKTVAPPGRIENPERGGKYERQKWRKETLEEVREWE